MRNYASAAHPNQVELTGLDLAQWLEVCVVHVINTPPDTVTARTGRLLGNIKKVTLTLDQVAAAATHFNQLPPERADTLASGLFGIYVDPDRSPGSADNVRRLLPKLWPSVGEETRRNFGVKLARYAASADTDPSALQRRKRTGFRH